MGVINLYKTVSAVLHFMVTNKRINMKINHIILKAFCFIAIYSNVNDKSLNYHLKNVSSCLSNSAVERHCATLTRQERL